MVVRIPLAASKADFLRVADANPASRVELWDGEIIVTPPNGGSSSNCNARLTAQLCRWAEQHGYVAFDSSAGFELAQNVIFAPDGAIVRAEDWAALTREERMAFVRIVPVVAIEIASPSDRRGLLRRKLERFRAAGTAFVALIDPERETIWTDGTPPPGFDLDLEAFLT